MTLISTLHELMQNREREDVCQDLISPAHDNPMLLSNIITGHINMVLPILTKHQA
jgi:hypothetical protein